MNKLSRINMNILNFTLLLSFAIILTSCFSTYPILEKNPCQETTTEEKLMIIEDAYNSRMKPKELKITNEGVTMNGKSYQFDNIKYVRAKTKLGPIGLYKKYWVQIREFNGDMNIIYTRDHTVLKEANNALMCLAGLHETNGRPSKSIPTNTTNKYDDLEKLKELLDNGAISQEEYEVEKEKVLNKN